MIVYATPDDIRQWPAAIPDSPDDAAWARSATIVVAHAAGDRNVYTDQPDPVSAQALKDAVCAQCAFWVANGIDPVRLGGGQSAPIKASSTLGDSVTFDTTAQNAMLAELADCDVAPEAKTILELAGLLYVPMPLGADPNDTLPSWGTGALPLQVPWTDPLSGETQWPWGWDWTA